MRYDTPEVSPAVVHEMLKAIDQEIKERNLKPFARLRKALQRNHAHVEVIETCETNQLELGLR